MVPYPTCPMIRWAAAILLGVQFGHRQRLVAQDDLRGLDAEAAPVQLWP